MKKTMLALIAVLILIFGTPVEATAATTSNSRDYSALAAEWWTWALTQPVPTNPLLDTTGAQCGNQQSGNIWFLGGLFNADGTVTRSCTIPSHTSVFFPLANYVDVEYAVDNVPAKTVRSFSDFVQSGASNLAVVLDGKSMASTIQFEHSNLFSFAMPDNNVFGAPAGFMNPCADSGYYALLNNLPSGSHTLVFSGTLTQPGRTPSTITATYHLSVTS
ncbi:hypothetical protein [Arthrobacter sp. C152]